MVNDILDVDVQQRDIDRGSMGGQTCPISQAIMRRYPEIKDVFTSHRSIRLNDKWYDLPPSACQFIEAFDHHGRSAVQPFFFHARLTDGHKKY